MKDNIKIIEIIEMENRIIRIIENRKFHIKSYID